MELFDTTYKTLNVALGAAGQRHEVIANNIANVNTPNFKRSDVSFQSQLQSAVDSAGANGDSSALDGFTPTVQQDNTTSMRADGNNVDVDVEMASLAENNIQYNALVQLAAKKLKSLEYVISDGRR